MTLYMPTGNEESLPHIYVCAGCHTKQRCQNLQVHRKTDGSCQDCGEGGRTIYVCTGFKVGIT